MPHLTPEQIAERKLKLREKMARYRAEAKAKGLCYRCKRPARPGGVLCEEHRRSSTAQELKHAIAMGKKVYPCQICGELSGRRYCTEHWKQGIQEEKEEYKQLEEAERIKKQEYQKKCQVEKEARTSKTAHPIWCTYCGIYGHTPRHCRKYQTDTFRGFGAGACCFCGSLKHSYEVCPGSQPLVGLETAQYLILCKAPVGKWLREYTGRTQRFCTNGALLKVLSCRMIRRRLWFKVSFPGNKAIYHLLILAEEGNLWGGFSAETYRLQCIAEAHRKGLIPKYEPLNDSDQALDEGDL